MAVNITEEIEESKGTDPDPKRTVRTNVPEVQIRLFNRSKGPIATFNSILCGWDQDRIDIQEILEKFGFKTIYSFNPSSGRGVPIRFNPKNGRSILPYEDGTLVLLDGEPKDPLVKPITKFLVGVVLIAVVFSVLMKDRPDWLRNSKFLTGMFPPWVLVCAVVVFIRLSKRTKGLIAKYVS